MRLGYLCEASRAHAAGERWEARCQVRTDRCGAFEVFPSLGAGATLKGRWWMVLSERSGR